MADTKAMDEKLIRDAFSASEEDNRNHELREQFREELTRVIHAYGIELSARALSLCASHYMELCEANKTTNLTRITSLHEACVLHYLDSLLLLPVWEKYKYLCEQPQTAPTDAWGLDMGSGAGFPGIPLSCALTKNFILCDSVNKKVAFLERFVAKYGLAQQIHAIHARLEELPDMEHPAFNLIVARAVSNLGVLIEYATPLLQPHGLLICSKARLQSPEIEQSKRAARICGLSYVSRETFELPESMGHRELVVFQKTGTACIKLPRKIGDALHKPL